MALVRKKGRSDIASVKDSKGKRIEFSLNAPEAKEVKLAGDFNNWDTDSITLRKFRDNMWRKELFLQCGRYEYKFIVDGNWMLDPNNNNRARNSLGSENSIIEV